MPNDGHYRVWSARREVFGDVAPDPAMREGEAWTATTRSAAEVHPYEVVREDASECASDVPSSPFPSTKSTSSDLTHPRKAQLKVRRCVRDRRQPAG